MKMINKDGKLFNKINILDFIFILAIIFLIFLSGIKIMGKELQDIGSSAENVKVEFGASILMDAGYLDVIKEGDRIGELKRYLDSYIKEVEIAPLYSTNLNFNGEKVISIHPSMEIANIVVAGDMLYDNMSYKLGNQELRQGKIIFIESDFYRLKGQINWIKVVE